MIQHAQPLLTSVRRDSVMIMPKVTTNEEEILCRHNTVKKLRAIQLLYDIHNNDMLKAYDRGLVNGLALAISILTEQLPKYVYKNKHGAFSYTPDDLPPKVFEPEAPDTTAGEPE